MSALPIKEIARLLRDGDICYETAFGLMYRTAREVKNTLDFLVDGTNFYDTIERTGCTEDHAIEIHKVVEEL